jgi:hypothetical protein
LVRGFSKQGLKKREKNKNEEKKALIKNKKKHENTPIENAFHIFF